MTITANTYVAISPIEEDIYEPDVPDDQLVDEPYDELKNDEFVLDGLKPLNTPLPTPIKSFRTDAILCYLYVFYNRFTKYAMPPTADKIALPVMNPFMKER